MRYTSIEDINLVSRECVGKQFCILLICSLYRVSGRVCIYIYGNTLLISSIQKLPILKHCNKFRSHQRLSLRMRATSPKCFGNVGHGIH